jgi:hypothetical protein
MDHDVSIQTAVQHQDGEPMGTAATGSSNSIAESVDMSRNFTSTGANTPPTANERPASGLGGGVARFTYLRGQQATSFTCSHTEGVNIQLKDLTAQRPKDKDEFYTTIMTWYEQTLELHMHDSSPTKASLAWWAGLDALASKVLCDDLLKRNVAISLELEFNRAEADRRYQWECTKVLMNNVPQDNAGLIESLRAAMSGASEGDRQKG